MPKSHTIHTSADIAAGLKSPDLRQALYDEGAVIMADTLLTLSGERHRKRRLIEFGVFRKDYFQWYEQTVFPASVGAVLTPCLDIGRADLASVSVQSTVNLTADFAGIDRPQKSKSETLALLHLVEIFSQGATIIHSSRPKDDVRSDVRHALDIFEPDFLAPSIARRKSMLDQLAAGTITQADVPRDVLTTLLQNSDPADVTPEVLLREIAFFLQAGSHSTSNATVHAFHDIVCWADAAPDRWDQLRSDPFFLQRCVHESLRLHPASPVAFREAMCPMQLAGAGHLAAGDTVEFKLAEANTDTALFGDDGDIFNPLRQISPPTLPFGHTFGTGVHACLGRDLAGGAIPKTGADPATHPFGTVTLLLRTLFRHGARPDPDTPPQPAEHTERPNWGCYPIVFKKELAWT